MAAPAQNLKREVLTCLTKLSDRDTHTMAATELESIARRLEASHVATFLSCIHATDASDRSPVRKQCVRLVAVLSESHGDALAPHLSKMLGSITRRLRDPDSAVRSACQNAVASLSRHVTRPPFSSFAKPLSEALFTEQEVNAQIGAAMCLAAAVDAAADPEPARLAKMLPKFERLLKSDAFKAKPALLTLVGSVIGSGGASGQAAHLVPCLVGFLSSDDWAARKASAEALTKLAVAERDALSEFKAGSMKTFESRKFDKVKGVREVMIQMMEAWKQIPDLSDEASPPRPEDSNASSRGLENNASDARHPAGPRICGVSSVEASQLKKKTIAASRSTPPDSSYATTARKRSPFKSNDKKVNSSIVRKPGHQKPSDTTPNGYMEGDENVPERNNGKARRALFQNSSDNKVHRFGALRAGSRVAPYHEHSSESIVVVSNITEDIHKNHRDCEDMSLIRSQLVQIEKQQSNLFDLLQKFIGSSQNGMRSLETRVHGLELALDDISYDLALSSGRMTNIESHRKSCCMLPGADFWSSKFWKKAEGRYSTPRLPNFRAAAAMRYKADDNGNAEASNGRFRLPDRSGFISNPLAEIRPDSRGILEVAHR